MILLKELLPFVKKEIERKKECNIMKKCDIMSASEPEQAKHAHGERRMMITGYACDIISISDWKKVGIIICKKMYVQLE